MHFSTGQKLPRKLDHWNKMLTQAKSTNYFDPNVDNFFD